MIKPATDSEPPVGTAAWIEKTGTVLGVILSSVALFYIVGGFRYLQIDILLMQYRGVMLALVLTMVFLLYPAKRSKKRENVPWYDMVIIIMGLMGSIYVVAFQDLITEHMDKVVSPTWEKILGVAMFLIIIEGKRRIVGLPVAIIVVFFLLYPLFSNYFPGLFQSRAYSLDILVQTGYLMGSGVLGMAFGIGATIIISFIIFGQFLLVTGAGGFFTDAAYAVLGHVRGGPAKGAIVASALMGTINGSSSANVATTGAITIPLMKKTGYSPHFAGAVEAVSSNGGQIMPPVMGAVAFIIPEFIDVTYLQVCMYAAIPAVLYFFSEFLMVDFQAAKIGLKGMPRSELPSIGKVMQKGWVYLIPIAILLYFLVIARYSPEKCGVIALLALVVVSSFRKESRLTPQRIVQGLAMGAKNSLLVLIATAGAGIIIGSVLLTGLGAKMSVLLVWISGGALLPLLLLTAGTCFILGLGIGGISIYLMLAVLVAPGLVNIGIIPIAAHLFVFWWGLVSYITPPVCAATWVASAIAGSPPIKTGWEATRLGIVTLVLPFAFVYNPALLLIGSPTIIVPSVLITMFGTAALAAGLIGYLFKPLNWTQRIVLVGGALTIFVVPSWTYRLVGVGIVSMALVWHILPWLIARRDTGKKGI